MKFINIKEQILQYAQRMHSDGLVAGTSGNISIFDSDERVMAITPSSEDYMEMTLNSIVVMDLKGNIIEGKNRPSSEYRMHTEIYKNRQDIKSVVHTHSPYATGFAVLHEPVPVILIEMLPWLKGEIPVCEFALPGTSELGVEALKVLVSCHACLISNHGVLAVGENIQKAYMRAIYTEDAARIYHIAKSVGEPVLVPYDALSEMRKRM
jgi:L-ribulose-5-phosphate 4-epimerase